MHIQSTTRAVVFGLLLFPICLFGQIFTYPVKNALVLNTAPIQPAQAYIDNIGKFIGNPASITVSNATTLTLSNSLFTPWTSIADIPTLVFGNNLGSASLTDILTTLDGMAGSPDGGSLNISSNPSTVQVETLTMEIPSLPVTSTQFVIRWLAGVDLHIDFDSGFALSASSLDNDPGDPVVSIGISDSPTTTQICAKIASLLPEGALSASDVLFGATASSSKVTFYSNTAGSWPISLFSNSSVATQFNHTSANANLKSLTVNKHWIITAKSSATGLTAVFQE